MNPDPIIKEQKDRSYFGIRFTAPYRGMFSKVAMEFKKLDLWIKENSAVDLGSRFLRYHVIDMSGNMELEVGIFGTPKSSVQGLVSTGVMPGGRFATLVYRGLGLAANKALLDWIKVKGHSIDKWSQPPGEAFSCRYEAYLTDPKVEPRKKQWDIELAIRLKD